MSTILVLNPNATEAVTSRMRDGCRDLALPSSREVVFHTLAPGPAGIETQRDVERVVIPTCDFFHAHPADAYVIGCFSDPGLHLAREEIASPVLGIAECAYREAAAMGRFGVVSIKAGSIPRHARALRELGLIDLLAGDLALDLGVLELLDAERTVARAIEVGRLLRDRDGAVSIVLGCSTMGACRPQIEAALGIPVIDPTRSAVLSASAAIRSRGGRAAPPRRSRRSHPPR